MGAWQVSDKTDATKVKLFHKCETWRNGIETVMMSWIVGDSKKTCIYYSCCVRLKHKIRMHGCMGTGEAGSKGTIPCTCMPAVAGML